MFSYDSTKGVGKIYSGGGGANLRGGYWVNGSGAGIYAIHLVFTITNAKPYFGFHCVYRPQNFRL